MKSITAITVAIVAAVAVQGLSVPSVTQGGKPGQRAALENRSIAWGSMLDSSRTMLDSSLTSLRTTSHDLWNSSLRPGSRRVAVSKRKETLDQLKFGRNKYYDPKDLDIVWTSKYNPNKALFEVKGSREHITGKLPRGYDRLNFASAA